MINIMTQFIEVTKEQGLESILINIDSIVSVRGSYGESNEPNGTCIEVSNDTIYAIEPYVQIKKVLKELNPNTQVYSLVGFK